MQTAVGSVWKQNFNSMGLNRKYKNIIAASHQLPEWVFFSSQSIFSLKG